MPFLNRKKNAYILLLSVAILAGIKSYSYITSKTNLESIEITNPAPQSTVNGVVRIAAKIFGKAENVKFTFTDNNGEIVKEAKGYFEVEDNEWVYYLNSLDIESGTYSVIAAALSKEGEKNNSISINIANDADSISFAKEMRERNEEKKEFDKESDSLKSQTPIESLAVPELQLPEISEEPPKEENHPEKLAEAVVTALTNLYDEINNNLSTSTNQGQVAGAFQENKKTRKQENNGASDELSEVNPPSSRILLDYGEASNKAKKQENNEAIQQFSNITIEQYNNDEIPPTSNVDAEDKKPNDLNEPTEFNWFNYKIKIIKIENHETLKLPYTLSASCNNPLDSLEFILDNLETPQIDYSFKASNNYGYYTYWTYKLGSEDIESGDYLLYAKGTIDWHSYESPMIIVRVE
ncbi:hypothetical protein A2Y83_03210 [Candidatus Falkowbacteria bacterium RBG_13_39_14]|uniref:Bacterial Ig-like domain-containing protein n=1 Tax=Candidatus Falkowbacteria bacterium RBG_13_39_14 TaxID=1797985 RepID=A0A1F5S5M3_9BACT|nr:MAG: hypothetical protein A2Y83_03210 [Candidatus Falkowbacteria bacterium RBG_13_39_14]